MIVIFLLLNEELNEIGSDVVEIKESHSITTTIPCSVATMSGLLILPMR